MNFYDYYQVDEHIEGGLMLLAANELIKGGFQVIPLAKGGKAPVNVKDVHLLLSKPIHSFNVDYYFKDRNVDIGLILTDGREVLDVDSKNKDGLSQQFLKAFSLGWPELYEKMVIQMTPSGGLHLHYTSEIVGGPAALAKIPGRPNPVTIIERLSKQSGKHYVKIAPSEGYKFIQGDPFCIPFITAEERNWIIALAMSFNEVHIPEVKKREADRKDSPWSVFNAQNDWTYIRDQLQDRGWNIVMELNDKVVVKRPGATSRHSGYIFKESNTLYLFSSSSEFEDGKAYTPFGIYAQLYHDNNIGLASAELAKNGIGVNNTEEGQFWKRKGKKVEIKYGELLNWLHAVGYRKYSGTLVQVINNIVSVVEVKDLKTAFLNEIEPEMSDSMMERVSIIFSESGGLMAMLKELEDNFIKDDRENTWLFFKNVAVKCNGEASVYDYKSLTGYIWQSDIIQREYYQADHEESDAFKFVQILGGDNADKLCKILGFTISRYKDPMNARAVVLMEDIEAENEGESQGGSGKSLLFQFVKQFRKSADYDGKNFNPADPFVWQNVEADTSLIFIDDVDKKFRFTSLFSIITGSMMINKKNKPQVVLPFERSPKIFITSNYSVGDMDISSRRRKHEFAVRKFFGSDIEPSDVFHRQFFNEWPKEEWIRFDNFIIHCCNLYIQEPSKKSIGIQTKNSLERSLVHNTNAEFVEYMDSQWQSNFFDFAPAILKNGRIERNGSLVTNAVNMTEFRRHENDPDYYFTMSKEEFASKIREKVNYKGLSSTRVTQWLKAWADQRKITVDSRYQKGASSEKLYRIISWPNYYHFSENGEDKKVVIDENNSGNELPF